MSRYRSAMRGALPLRSLPGAEDPWTPSRGAGDDASAEFELYEGDCAGCEIFGRVTELGLCEGCSGKLERDLIRNRDWAYSVTAFGLTNEQREDVRRQVVRKYGKGLELIAPSRQTESTRKRHKGRKRK